MISKNEKISNFQLMILIVHTIIGVGTLSMPSALAESVNSDGWVVLLIGSFLVCIVVAIITKLMMMYPGKTIVEIGRELVGNTLTSILMIIIIIYLMSTSAFIVRIFAEVIKAFLLLNTPIEVIILTFLFATVYISRCGIEPLARICMIIAPIVFFPLAILALMLIQDLDFTNLLPLFRFEIMDVVKAIPSSFFTFGGFELILIYIAFVEKPKKSMKYSVLGIVIVALIYLSLFIISIARFGAIGLAHQLWPLLSIMKTVEFPGAFIENVDGIVMSIWVLIAFTTLGAVLFVSSIVMARVFKLKEHNIFVLALIPIIFILSLVPDNVVQVYEYMSVSTNYLGSVSAIGIPILFFIIALFKNRGGEKKNEQDA